MTRSPLGFGFLPTVSAPRYFLVAASGFDHDDQIPTAERTRCCSLFTEWGNRGHRSREGELEDQTSQGCLWLRRHPSRYYQSELPSHPHRPAANNVVCRRQ